jgi:hypothetical protein
MYLQVHQEMMIHIHLKGEVIRRNIHHVVMVTIVSLPTVHTNIHQSGVYVRMAHNATILIVLLTIHEIVRSNVSMAVNVENRVVPICIQTRANPNILIIPLIDQKYTTIRRHTLTEHIHILSLMKRIFRR